MTDSALSHIRVLDLSRILAGPWASQLLADLGAEVIKVERPGRGDDTRSWGPPWLGDGKGGESVDSAYFSCANRNKKSIAVDITKTQGQKLLHRLVKECDILIENFKVGGLKKYHLDYGSLKSINPKLIYCSITGFGQTGPLRHRAGYDFMIQAMGGLMSITGVPDGEAGAGPQKVGVALADVLTGLYASNACLAALAYRERTGRGQAIDLALLDVQVAALANQASNYLVSGKVPERLGNSHPNIVPYQSFETADGHFILAVGNDSQFERLCDFIHQPQWTDEKEFKTNAQRVERRSELIPLLIPVFQTHTSEYWICELEKLGIPCGPINTIDRVFQNEQVKARGLEVEAVNHASARVKMVANPIRLSESPLTSVSAPPLLGQDTDYVLQKILRIDDAEYTLLCEQGIIHGPDAS